VKFACGISSRRGETRRRERAVTSTRGAYRPFVHADYRFSRDKGLAARRRHRHRHRHRCRSPTLICSLRSCRYKRLVRPVAALKTGTRSPAMPVARSNLDCRLARAPCGNTWGMTSRQCASTSKIRLGLPRRPHRPPRFPPAIRVDADSPVRARRPRRPRVLLNPTPRQVLGSRERVLSWTELASRAALSPVSPVGWIELCTIRVHETTPDWKIDTAVPLIHARRSFVRFHRVVVTPARSHAGEKRHFARIFVTRARGNSSPSFLTCNA